MAWAWYGKCESDTAALCKSNGKDTFLTLSGTAWQGNGMGEAWERQAMCESALRVFRDATLGTIQMLELQKEAVNIRRDKII